MFAVAVPLLALRRTLAFPSRSLDVETDAHEYNKKGSPLRALIVALGRDAAV